MNLQVKHALALFFISLALPVISHAQPATDFALRIDSLLSSYQAADPGLSLTISQGGQTIYHKHIGMANLEYGVPVTDSTIFEAGSVSKQFTATAILLLAQDGQLTLDDPARKYVPELPEYAHTITIRHLLNHTSGLKDWGALAGLGGWPRGSREYTNNLALGYIVKQPTLNNVPGDEYIYSNSNYTLLTIIAERVSGQKLPEFTQMRIFDHLGMRSTSWRDNHQRVVKGRATGYSRSQEGFATDMPFENTYGHAALLTTTKDLDKWNRSWRSTPLGAPNLLKLRTETGVLNDGTPITYASAVMVDEYLSHPRVYHTGSTAGYRALLTYYPTEDLSIALLSNNGSTNVGNINNGLAAIFFGNRRDTDIPTENNRDTAADQVLALPADIAGYYESPECGGAMQVITEGGSAQVIWKEGRQRPLQLKQTGANSFQAANQQSTLAFKRNDAGHVVGFYISVPRARNVWFGRTSP
ncbi:beta-lactamase family protein [Parapedobacter sp. ISTM3]|uniref:serine hydrolase domain-containing protein n=1 Tax=Parapedobacter sp. ISTM3 TaxID=2800130 RepID=UPI00190339FA|nr:serine hydrolase domain-containing protein [Parapedobacter sp. ISTM3]MBK1441168.1 beta-lactamase family protein [Parapedobacter sp. ISTM3]